MWSEEEINLLKKYYPLKGVEYCSKIITRSIRSIKAKASRLGIKLTPEYISNVKSENVLKHQRLRKNKSFKVNPDKFYNIKDPEVCYYLGLFWSDGYLYKNSLDIYCNSDDIKEIKDVLDSIGKWSYYYKKPKQKTWKDITRVYTYNKRISEFFRDNDFETKSISSPTKIINKIPNELRHYFFRGLVDGDGCFYFKERDNKISNRQFSITSSYEQDWSYVTELFDSLSVKYRIRKVSNKSSYSQIRITRKGDIKIIGDYIYGGKQFGFTRKLDKFRELIK